MAKGEGGGCGSKDENDFYGVLGLKKECTEVELRSAYKKLAMRWHPDRCSAGGSEMSVEEAKKKFQDIQEAYSVLSDSNKRFLYDVGVYDKEEDDENIQGMGDFLTEMAAMMQQNKPDENGKNGGDSFENLQDLFQEMFQADIASFSSSAAYNNMDQCSATSFSFSFGSYSETSNTNNKRNSTNVGGGSSQLGDRSKRRNSRQTSQYIH